jgi:hypothetical protein
LIYLEIFGHHPYLLVSFYRIHMSQDQRRYNDEEVGEILRRAIERQLKRQSVAGTTKLELIEAAKEVGVSASDLEAAAVELEAERSGRTELETLASYTKKRQRRRRKSFLMHFSVYALVSAFFVALNILTTGLAIPWALFPILSWGLGVGIHGAAFLLGQDEEPEKIRQHMEREQRSRRKEQDREERRLRRQQATDDLARSATEFGHSVVRGAGTLLNALSSEISSRSNPTQSAQSINPPGLPVIERHNINPNETNQTQPEEVSVGASNTRSNR